MFLAERRLRSRAPSIAPDTFFVAQSWADFIITTSGLRFSVHTGAAHGQEMPPERMEALIRAAGRRPSQRTTLYTPAATERRSTSLNPVPLARTVNPPPHYRSGPLFQSGHLIL